MFDLRAFGGLALSSRGGSPPASAHQRRRLALLVRLAVAGARGISRDRLLAQLWPDSSAERAQHALDQLVYATRRDLGKESVVAEGGQLRLDPTVVWCDVAEFEAMLDRGDRAEGVALYAGPFLDGVHLSGGTELEQWATAERSRLEQRLIDALERLGRDAASRGDATTAVQWWRRRAGVDPLSAVGARGLLDALAATGDDAAARQYLQTYTALVRHELGVEPDATLIAFTESRRTAAAAQPSGALPVLTRGPVRSGEHEVGAVNSMAPPDQPPETARTPQPGSNPTANPIPPSRSVRMRRGRRWTAALAAGGVTVALGVVVANERAVTEPPVVPPASVAVLPFDDLSSDGSAGYLGEGMSEELIHVLAQLPNLQVTARTSSFAVEARHSDIREIARSLGVATVVEGSVRRENDRLRVTAQLIDAATGYHLWSGAFDRRMGDALGIQNEIAVAIGRTLRPQLTRQPASGTVSTSSRAYHLYLQGRYAWNQRTEADLRRSIGFFEQAIAADSSYAAPHAGLADAYDALVDHGFMRADPGYRVAEAAARRAIALDSTLAEAHAALGHLQFHDWNWTAAERTFARALELNPSYALTYSYYALPLVMQGRFDEGLAMMEKARELDPLTVSMHGGMSWLLFLASRHDQAIDQARMVIAMDSMQVSSHARLGVALVERGQFDEGITSLERAVALGGGYYRSALPMLGYAYAQAGRAADAERIRVAVERGLQRDSLNLYYAAAFMGRIGERERAFELLDHAYAVNRGCLIDIAVDPMMRDLRSDPRYGALVRALGIGVARRGS